MALQDGFNELLQRQMTRQQFLKTAGIAILSVIGVSRMLDTLQKSQSQSTAAGPVKHVANGYGMSVYEGIKR